MKISRHHPSRKFAPEYRPLLGVGPAWCAMTVLAAVAVGLSIVWLLMNPSAH